MELALTILAGIGILLFLIGYLGFLFAGFRQNFVTGIISALPVLNIVTVPALWHKASKKIMISVLGIVIAISSWFLGADTNIKKLLFASNDTTIQAGVSNNNAQAEAIQGSGLSATLSTVSQVPKQVVGSTVIRPLVDKVSASPFANVQRIIDESDMLELPGKALYKLSFESIPVNKINTLKNRVIQLITKKNKIIEGRISKITETSIFIQSGGTVLVENEFPIANIKQLRLMVKKAISQ